MSSFKAKQRKWLREASMRRLSQIVKDKTELIDSAQKLRMNITTIDGLEESGLSKQSIQHLENWVEGVESGRECMFALLDTLHNSKDITPSTKTGQFKPLDVVQALLNLPEEFLCDHGYLFEKVFSRPPATVVKEAVQIIVKKAEEQNSSSLGLQQINLALKQLRLDAICSANPIVEPVAVEAAATTATTSDAPTGEVDEAKDAETAADTIDDHVRQQIVLRVKIITELLRIHVKTMAKRKSAAASHLAGKKPTTTRFNDLHHHNYDGLHDEDDTDDAAAAAAAAAAFDLRKLREFVSTPVQEVHAQAMQSPAESLEQTNTVLKPYLRRLSSLKMLLTTQLNELRDSKAFLSLGLSPDASDEDIKRAYRILAVRLHPDKPGGDTAKFQQLQAMYQEVLKRRKTKRDEEDAVQQMKAKRQEAQAQYQRQRESRRTPSATAAAGDGADAPDDDDDDNARSSTAAEEEDEDRELDELLRKIDRDLQRDAEDLAGFATQKAQLKRRGGLATDDESEEEKPHHDSDDDGDKENLHEGSENDASSTGDSPRTSSDTKPSATRRTTAASQPSSSSLPDEPDEEAEELPDDEDNGRDRRAKRSGYGGEPLVEDVDDDDDDDAAIGGGRFGSGHSRVPSSSSSSSSSAAHNGSRLAAALLKLALPDKPSGPFPTDEAHAAALVQYTATLLPLLHQAASKATQATQRMIKWQKQWDKLFKDAGLTPTQRLDRLLHVAVQSLGGHVAFIDHISAPSTSSSTSTSSSMSAYHEAQRQRILSSPIRAVAPALEVVCDITQRIAATGMSLASDCGTDYMAAISLETTFLREIEATMNDSLGCLRAVVPLSTSLDQLMACVQRAYDTQRLTLSSSSSSSLASSSTLVDLLADMMRTAMKNAVGSHCGAIDGLMAAATTATALSERLRDLQSKVQRQVLLDAKRHADYERMRHEEEEEYSAEDREAMRRARTMQQQPPSPRSKDGANGDEDNDDDVDDDEAVRRKNGDDDVDPLTGEALQGMDLLKHKIRKLQVQLYLQQVAALQTMNAETVTLQDHILQELQSMTFLAAPKATASSTTSTTATATAAVQGVSSEVVESVVSLVAEMLDASLAQFRLQYQQHRPSLSVPSSSLSRPTDTFVTQLIHTYTTSDDRTASARRLRHSVDRDWVSEALTKHLVWCLDVVLSDHSHVALPTLLTAAEFTVADPDIDAGAGADADAGASPNAPPPPKMMPKVALLPDYRAKTLYLASVLDLPAVRHLLFAELPQKLQEILAEDD